MLEHIGLTVVDYSEIKEFYQDLLGFKLDYDFQISAELSEKMFGIEEKSRAYMLSKNGLKLELFVSRQKNMSDYNHLCFSIKDREAFIQKAKEKGYECTVIKRDKSDLVFVKDKSNNIFEIKK